MILITPPSIAEILTSKSSDITVDWISRSEFGLGDSVIEELAHLESQGYYFLRHIAHDTDPKVRREYGGRPYYEAVKREPDGEKQCHVVFH